MQAVFWMTVAPAELHTVGMALAERPEVTFAAAVTGRTNRVASACFPDVQSLCDYLAHGAVTTPGVRTVQRALAQSETTHLC